jgi:hypothetical protein
MGVVDDLVANPGLYLGIDRVAGTDYQGVARIQVTALPGGAGVTLDYEVFNPAMPDNPRAHVEHTVVARTHDGPAIMVIGHTHAESASILHETDPGTFELVDEASPYPMKVVVSVPEAGRLHHAWWYGPAGGEAIERDVAELSLTP